ncbi:MAG TPA: Ppx/GppA phosphatase family protein [Anaeromyxobacter sp.]|nr:Ppx/GppA phosphatase family protein [Anaeromyxobacter sp.]
MSERFATIDVGTNTVLLLVAEREGGGLRALRERAEITRLGRGVDATGLLRPEAIRDTVAVLAEYAAEARALGARDIACVATSAARDAQNGADFFAAARREAGLAPEVVSGDEEARLVYLTAWRDFGGGSSAHPLAVLDVGGGSTEFIVGEGPAPRDRVSLQAGAVRLTERHLRTDPIPPAELAALRAATRRALDPLGALRPGPGARLVGVAGTVTTLSAVVQALTRYDGEKVHGSTLSLAQVEELVGRLAALPVAARAALPGMEPKRADVIVAGALVVAEAMRRTGFPALTVSDRGVRWGLLYDRFGA